MKWLPDGSGLIFGAREQQAGLDQLWHVSYPGGEVRRITTDLASYTGVSLSADAGMLVTTQIDHPLNIWVVPEGDSSRARPITSGRHFIGGLSWTTDNRIVYSSGDVTPKDISVVASDGSGQQTLAAGSDSAGYVLPSVSPDGRYIISVSRGRIWRMDVDGANPKALTTSGRFASSPQVTPDGQLVIYHSNDQRDSRLYKVSINGGEPVQISDKLIWRAQISPDGNQIACLYHETWNEPYKIPILPLAGGPPVKVFDIPSGLGRLLRWSYDGRALYYTDERDGISNIWRVSVDTDGSATQITKF
jgi:Tol biopolymer transport system component